VTLVRTLTGGSATRSLSYRHAGNAPSPASGHDGAVERESALVRIGLDAAPLLGPRTGIGRYTWELARALAGRDGADVSLVAVTWRGADRLPRLAAEAGATAVTRRFPARLARELWLRTGWPTLELLGARVDVVHGTNFVLPASRAAGVVTIHDLGYLRFPDQVRGDVARYAALVPWALRRGAVVCAPTRAVADEVQDTYRLPPDRVVVTPLGVAPEWFAPPPPTDALGRLHLPDRYLAFVGTLEPRKNLPRLLDAYRRLRASSAPGDPPGLVLAGPPGWGEQLDLAGLLDADSPVRLTGWLGDDDLRALVAGSAALVLPSRYEGFGLPALEAMAAGVPVLAGDVPALREVCGPHAWYVDPDDTTALAEGLRRAATTQPPTTAAARQEHARRFTWTATAAATRTAYERALAS
jgi:glycosyltransferase involved in cell wall biosynthesis